MSNRQEFWDDKSREVSSISDTIKLYENKGLKFIKENNDNKYDILFHDKNSKPIKVEVKQDFSCFRTGNIGVEYHCRGKESGIFTSQADIYVYKIHQNTDRVYKSKKETEKPKDITILEIDKHKLKSCISQLVEENKDSHPNDLGKESRKYNFRLRTIKDENENDYVVQVRFINGGDIGSNSLNVLFTRDSFLNSFSNSILENRNRTEQEQKDLDITLNNAKKRFSRK